MAQTLPPALQLCGYSDYLEAGLAERFDLVRWFEMGEAERTALLGNRADEFRAVVTGGHVGCPPELMRALPALELIAINGVGFDKVDIPLAKERGVAVTNTPDVLTDDVADLAVGLLIAQLRGIAAGDAHVRAGKWPASDVPLGRKVTGLRFGVLGLGRIGQAIAERLVVFGDVAYHSRSPKPVAFRHVPVLADLAEWADVLIVACAATPDTHGLVDAGILRALGPQGVLVNVARGSVVDEQAVVAALEAGDLGGAALDVFVAEPEVPAALRASSRTVLTPHVGSATAETRKAMADLVLANVDAWLAGDKLPTPVT